MEYYHELTFEGITWSILVLFSTAAFAITCILLTV